VQKRVYPGKAFRSQNSEWDRKGDFNAKGAKENAKGEKEVGEINFPLFHTKSGIPWPAVGSAKAVAELVLQTAVRLSLPELARDDKNCC